MMSEKGNLKRQMIKKVVMVVVIVAAAFAVGVFSGTVFQKRNGNPAGNAAGADVGGLPVSDAGDLSAREDAEKPPAGDTGSLPARKDGRETVTEKEGIIADQGTVVEKEYIGKEEALNIACSHAKVGEEDAFRVRVDLEREDGIMVYEVDFEDNDNEYDYEINADTGEILKAESERKDGTLSSARHSGRHGNDADVHTVPGTTADLSACIGDAAALAIALEDADVAETDLTKKKVELDEEDGRMIYEVEFDVGRTEYEYEIDALSGGILKAETDHNS